MKAQDRGLPNRIVFKGLIYNTDGAKIVKSDAKFKTEYPDFFEVV